MGDNPNITEGCRVQSKIFEDGLNMGNLKEASLTMLDASGKLPSGIGQGNQYELGSYEECIRVHYNPNQEDSFRAKYCKGYIKPHLNNEKEDDEDDEDDPMGSIMGAVYSSYRGFSWGVCVPENCSAEDIETHVKSIFPNGEVTGRFYNSRCFNGHQDIQFDTLDLIFTWIILTLSLVIIISTAKDLFKRYGAFWIGKEKSDFSTDGEGSFSKVLASFSIYRNGAELFKTKQSRSSIRCLNGIRFFSMSWVILGHGTYSFVFGSTSLSWYNLSSLTERWELEVLFNAYPSVDTFLFLSGFLLAYSLLPQLEKAKDSGENPWKVLPLGVVHRYLRLTPAYLTVIGFLATIREKVFVLGPNDKNGHTESCRIMWYKMILYIHTLFDGTVYKDDHEGSCMAQAWYLSLDMQIFIFCLPLTILIWRLPKKWSVSVATVVTLVAMLIPGILTMIFHFAPTDILQSDNPDKPDNISQHDVIYKKPWCRTMPYLVGMWLAFWMRGRGSKTPLKMSRMTVLLGWIIAFLCGCLVVYGMYPYNQRGPATWSNATAFFYSTFHRPVWALCLAWVVVACHYGYGGPINGFLGWSAFSPLSRLTYSSYLIHFVVLDLIWDNMRPGHVSLLIFSWIHISTVVVSMSFAIVLNLLVEMPTANLDKLLLNRQKKEEEKEKK